MTIVLLVLPSGVSLGVFLVVRGVWWEWWEITLFALDVVLMTGAVLFSAGSPYLAKLYYG